MCLSPCVLAFVFVVVAFVVLVRSICNFLFTVLLPLLSSSMVQLSTSIGTLHHCLRFSALRLVSRLMCQTLWMCVLYFHRVVRLFLHVTIL